MDRDTQSPARSEDFKWSFPDGFTLVEQNKQKIGTSDYHQEHPNCNKGNVIVILKMVGMTVLLISAALDRNKCTAPQPLQGLTNGTGPQQD